MFTIEYDHDNVEIVIVDDNGHHEDLKIDAFDDIVYLRQYDEELGRFETIMISPKMWEELIEALNKPEGGYIIR